MAELNEEREYMIKRLAQALDVPVELLGTTEHYSTGWCTPSETLMAMFRPSPDMIIYPDDCGKPHNWERHSVRGGCQCAMCEEESEYWLECSECIVTWRHSEEPAFRAAWEAAEWA